MPKFKYVGESPVDVPALRLVDVEPGQVVDVDDKDLAAGLAGQSTWEPVRTVAKKD